MLFRRKKKTRTKETINGRYQKRVGRSAPLGGAAAAARGESFDPNWACRGRMFPLFWIDASKVQKCAIEVGFVYLFLVFFFAFLSDRDECL